MEEYKELMTWLLSDDTGISSRALAKHLLYGTSLEGFYAPMDKWDRGRCIRMLNSHPEWWPIVNNLHPSSVRWAEQIDLIISEREEDNDGL